MDFKLKGRTWVGNIYHKFETICQEVDEFVTKDSVKYVESQVQNVGESVKKICSNVVHDFLPPLLDNEQSEDQVVVRKQNDAMGTYIRSEVGIKGKHRHASERQASKDQGTVHVINSNSSVVGNQRQFVTPLLYAESTDPSMHNSAQNVVENYCMQEEFPLPKSISSEDENSSLNWREDHQSAQDSHPPEDDYLSRSSHIPSDGDLGSMTQAEFFPINSVKDVRLANSQNNLRNCKSGGVGHERQFAAAPVRYADSHEGPETNLYVEKSSNSSTCSGTQKIAERNAMLEKYSMPECGSSADENSSLNWTEEHQLTEDLVASEDGYSARPSYIYSDGERRSTVEAKLRNFVEDVGLTTFKNDEKTCNDNDLSDESKTGLYFYHDCLTGMDSYIGAEGNSTNHEHPISKEKGPFELPLCTEEPHEVTYEFHFLQHESLVTLCPGNEDNKSSILAKFPQKIMDYDKELRAVGTKQTVCNTGVQSEEGWIDFPFEEFAMAKSGTTVEGDDAKDDAKDDPVNVEYICFPVCKGSAELSMCPGEENLVIEDPSALDDENLSESSPTKIVKDLRVIMLDGNTGHKALKAEDSECQIAYPCKVAETEMSLEAGPDDLLKNQDFPVQENCVGECRISIQHKDSCHLSICSTKLHLLAGEPACSEHENLAKFSMILSNDDKTVTNVPNVSPTSSVHEIGLKTFQNDETRHASLADKLSSELVTSSVCSENKDAKRETTFSRSSTLMEPLKQSEILLVDSARQHEKSFCGYTASATSPSSISSGTFSDLTSDSAAVKPVLPFSSRVPAAVRNDISGTNERVVAVVESSHGNNEKCRQEACFVGDGADQDMETIDLSDKVKLEDGCIFVDDGLLYTASARPRKFRSYKKMIQDAFASRKRIIKEYEQLAIWYGDIGTDLQAEQSHLPPVPRTASGYLRSSQTSDIGDPEWELL